MPGPERRRDDVEVVRQLLARTCCGCCATRALDERAGGEGARSAPTSEAPGRADEQRSDDSDARHDPASVQRGRCVLELGLDPGDLDLGRDAVREPAACSRSAARCERPRSASPERRTDRACSLAGDVDELPDAPADAAAAPMAVARRAASTTAATATTSADDEDAERPVDAATSARRSRRAPAALSRPDVLGVTDALASRRSSRDSSRYEQVRRDRRSTARSNFVSSVGRRPVDRRSPMTVPSVDDRVELELEDVLQRDHVGLHPLHLGDVGDAAGAVVEALEVDDRGRAPTRSAGGSPCIGRSSPAISTIVSMRASASRGRVGVDGRQRALVAGVHRLEHVERLGAADLADDDPVGPHAQRVADELADRDLAVALDVLRARLEAEDVVLVELELGGVLDRDDPVGVRGSTAESAFSSVVLPVPVPPEMRMLSSALTQRDEEVGGLLRRACRCGAGRRASAASARTCGSSAAGPRATAAG